LTAVPPAHCRVASKVACATFLAIKEGKTDENLSIYSLSRRSQRRSVLAAFSDAYRVLKPNSFCVCFYGWNRVDEFFSAWRRAGFRPVGHIVWQKNYASSTGFLQSRHEQAYLLIKGNPDRPAKPIADVRAWEYTGNRAHPIEKAVSILTPLIQAFSKRGDLVLDPFSGSGSTAVASLLSGRRYIGIELEDRYCRQSRTRLAGAAKYAARKAA